ncbi:helix-turn-helix domain-containing protein [Psychromonas sp. Urea-02u-13]|uniref:helix-turn-helix domain-containing protein n=1 Tax=Psychromonas sp. Urea-02u-13 TaxID=2058326 RepID=UPI000C33B9E6|nr:helix-turn-helix transcriptional regulator [Psychromonas sp. Urea-02u-13]PKG37001.1 XRE family transcriptional regulator [Psychromonas sp. Urea-02u-13]
MSAKDMFYSKSKDFSNADDKAYAREDLVFNVTEDLLLMLEDLSLSKAELARRLGKSKSYVTQILSGSRNMTLGSFSDICFALGFKPEIKLPVEPAKISQNGWVKSGKQTFTNKNQRKGNAQNVYLAYDAEWSKNKVA